ncbi:MAG TPA: hypothetical protein VJP78_08125, partial [Thermoleophilia bacterium]|nr:hypothetical protein [Thermoleophilia bacterium]
MRVFVKRNRGGLAVGAAYLLFFIVFNEAYPRFGLKSGKPIYQGRIDLPQSEMQYAVENLTKTRRGGQDVFALSGWAFPEGKTIPLAPTEQRVVLVDDHGFAHVFDAQSVPRDAVAQVHLGTQTDNDKLGFIAYISAFALRGGTYQIGLLYSTDDQGSTYGLTQSYLRRTPNSLELVAGPVNTGGLVDEVRLRLAIAFANEPASEVSYWIDGLAGDGQSGNQGYVLSGWAFCTTEGPSCEDSRRYVVLLDDHLRPFLFEAHAVPRPDVAEEFQASARNIDFAGFTSRISAGVLHPGTYRVGIAWTAGLDSPVYHMTDNYVEKTALSLELTSSPPQGMRDMVGELSLRVALFTGSAPLQNAAVWIDGVKEVPDGSDGSFLISGWAFLKDAGLDEMARTRYLMLVDEHSHVYLYRPRS